LVLNGLTFPTPRISFEGAISAKYYLITFLTVVLNQVVLM
jgi:hypothetical protein